MNLEFGISDCPKGSLRDQPLWLTLQAILLKEPWKILSLSKNFKVILLIPGPLSVTSYPLARVILPMTATHHVLSTPELVHEIFSWIDEDDYFSCEVGNDEQEAFLESIDWDKIGSLSEFDWGSCPKTYYYCKKGVLFRCALVNKLWWCEAVRFIWKRLGGDGQTEDLLGCFRSARFDNEPCRKQLHGNLVSQAHLWMINDDRDAEFYESLLQGVIFPNLQHLRLYCPKTCDYIPQLQCPSLRILEIDPQFECEFGVAEYALSQDQWDKVFCRISVSGVKFQKVIIFKRPGKFTNWNVVILLFRRFFQL